MKSSPPAITAGLLALLWTAFQPAFADNVRLQSLDGLMSVEGELISVDGDELVVATVVGTVRFPQAKVECFGAACPPPPEAEDTAPQDEPQADVPRGDVAISGSDILIERMLPDVLDHFSRTRAGSSLSRGGDDQAGWRYTMTNEAGAVISLAAISGGARQGIEDLISGRADIALVSRPMTETEAGRLLDGGLTAVRAAGLESVLATDGLVIVTDSSVGISSIRLGDIARVFAGKITNWEALGGPNLPITVFARESGSGTRDALNAAIMQPYDEDISQRVIGVDSDRGIADAVLAFPGSIGVTSFYATAGARALELEEPCGLFAAPEPFAMQTGRYPLTRHLYAYTRPDAATDGLAAELIRYLQSQEGQEALSEMGYIGHRITREGLENQRVRLAEAVATPPQEALLEPLREMVETLIAAERISPTFRPYSENGGDVLAKADARRLAEEIAAGRFDGRELLFVGFTDEFAAAPEDGLVRAQADALAVVAQVRGAGPDFEGRNVALRAVGYGGLSPLACSGTPIGKDINRRVEVWSRPLAESQ
ncbi:substrate-binding domain-containing protein [Algicella marina]|uniref:PBP domain-containing protein n=1 Tax=Algicella marina TaxID=2683284 RepID=A0A6P1T1W1_9RHOB|nr:substrate-binding domain-containing protein [Algicella marina]QHQ35643.1 hypothetical protein GO499_10875 [Algicella marina]